MKVAQLLLRYLVFVGIPYVIAKRINKIFWKHADSELKEKINKKLKDSPELDNIAEHTKDALDNRGGAGPITVWLVKIIMVDFPIKVAIAGAVGASIWSETADNAAAQLAKYGSAMLSAPGRRFSRLYTRIRGIDPQYSMDIREILFDRDLTNNEKLELLKIKIESVLKNLEGPKRKQFILLVIAAILFSVGGNFALFAWFMERLRTLIGTEDDADTVLPYIIECYKEYNAPLPKELTEALPEEIIKSITNID